jgi:hypothetical protein
MGAFALRRFGRRLLSPPAGVFGAGLLALVVAFPTAAEAHLNAFRDAQFGIPRTDAGNACGPRLPGRVWIRGPGICPEAISASMVIPQRMQFSGKLGLALVIGLYCRTTAIDLSEFMRQYTASLQTSSPPQRLIAAGVNEAVAWPAGRLDPAPDTGMIDALPIRRLPDG